MVRVTWKSSQAFLFLCSSSVAPLYWGTKMVCHLAILKCMPRRIKISLYRVMEQSSSSPKMYTVWVKG